MTFEICSNKLWGNLWLALALTDQHIQLCLEVRVAAYWLLRNFTLPSPFFDIRQIQHLLFSFRLEVLMRKVSFCSSLERDRIKKIVFLKISFFHFTNLSIRDKRLSSSKNLHEDLIVSDAVVFTTFLSL